MEQYNNILQNQIPYMSTRNTMHLYKNKDHMHVNCNPQHPELQHVPTIEINKSNNSCTKLDNIKFIYEDVYSSTSIKIHIKEKYKLNQ